MDGNKEERYMSKKVYITSLHLKHGGIEMAITLLANALVKRGYEVELLCTYNLGTPVYKLDERVNVLYLTDVHPNRDEFIKTIQNRQIFKAVKHGIYALKVIRLKKVSMTKIIKEIKEGSVIATRNEHAVILSKYGNVGVKKIAQLHQDHKFDKKLVHDFKSNYKNIDYFALLTENLREEVSEMMQQNLKTKCITIPNFLEMQPVTKLVEKENQVIAVGRLHEVKGFARMIRLWKKVSEKHDTILKIVGDGQQRNLLEEIIKKEQLDGKVVLAGELKHDEVMTEMAKSLAYLMTSFSEGFPFVLIEAMQMGLPVVAYDVRVGPRAIVDDKVNGFLIEDNCEELFVEKVDTLLSNEVLRKNMEKSAFEKAKTYSEEIVMDKWIEVIENN